MNSNDVSYKDQNHNQSLARYRARLSNHQFTPEALGWRSGTQEIRFRAFTSGFASKAPRSILDIGCGFGDLLTHLRDQGWRGSYLGIDLMPEFIDHAREKFKNSASNNTEFICCDFLEMQEIRKFDATFASGIFNHIRDDDNMEYVIRSLYKLKQISLEYTALDFLSTTSDLRRSDLCFYDPTEILKAGLALTKRISIDHTYMPFEFMLKLYWNDTFKKDWPAFTGEENHD